MARTKAKAKTPAKGKKATPAPETEKHENRYLRAARIIIEAGEGVDLAELAVRASMSEATAGHAREAFLGVTQALREARLLPQRAKPKAVPAKAPTAPVAPQNAEAPVPT
jgi:hypothetical protein